MRRFRMLLTGETSAGRKTNVLIDWAARFKWAFAVDKYHRRWTTVSIASTLMSAWGLRSRSGLLLAAGIVMTCASVAKWNFDLRRRASEGDRLSLVLTGAAPLQSYDKPYETWQAVPLGANARVIYDRDLNVVLREESPPISIRMLDAPWFPDGLSGEARRQWGARRGVRNEPKLRLASNLVSSSTEVALQRTDYLSYMFTNHLAVETLRRDDRDYVKWEDVGPHAGVIPAFDRSPLSNHLGGDLIAIEPGVIRVQFQSPTNLMNRDTYVATASGSFDADPAPRNGDSLVDLVKRELLRELKEEVYDKNRPQIPLEDVKVLGFSRATYTGGKPQFYAVARTPLLKGTAREQHVASIFLIQFRTSGGVKALIESLKDFGALRSHLYSPPLAVLLYFLEEWAQDDATAEEWLSKYW